MNRLVIIGNGFDLAHGLKTSYKDFITWYVMQCRDELVQTCLDVNDALLHIKLQFPAYEPYGSPLQKFTDQCKECKTPNDFFYVTRNWPASVSVVTEPFFDRILLNIENKGWTDIESDYYELLKKNSDTLENCRRLNKQLDFLKEKLAEYLETQQSDGLPIESITTAINAGVDENDIGQSFRAEIAKLEHANSVKRSDGKDTLYDVSKTMFLNFNYTATVEKYEIESSEINYIHGSLNNPDKMIFGYGDEMDKDYKGLEDKNINELLKNSKSVKYIETNNYRRLLQFIDSDLFQVFIMGHSCGNSDRTLLNTIFEHPNCVSIKPFMYINETGQDNYSELTMNIYRNFSDKKLFRDRVVVKPQCELLVK